MGSHLCGVGIRVCLVWKLISGAFGVVQSPFFDASELVDIGFSEVGNNIQISRKSLHNFLDDGPSFVVLRVLRG